MEKNKTAVVTAGSRGIGRAVVIKLISEGFEVFTCSRSQLKLEALTKDVEHIAPGSKLYSIPADLSKAEGVKDFLSFVKDHFQAIMVWNGSPLYSVGSPSFFL